MKKILLVAQFTQLPGEGGNNRGRFKLISELLTNNGYDVTVVTSKFRELDRTFRKWETIYEDAPYEIVILDEAGYYKNISFQRIYSMRSFSKNLEKYLADNGHKFDLIYSCVPGLDSALVAGRCAKKRGIPFIIDVQDVWPEVMYDLVLDVPIISDILFYPMQRMANQVYTLADGIIAVSKTYLDIAVRKNKKSKINDYVFIGTNLEDFDKKISFKLENSDINKPKDEHWISYIGSLGHSYDIKTFIEAAHLANKRGINVRPIILGSGPLEEEFKSFANKLGSNALFTGWVDHGTMGAYLKESDAVINAIKKKAPQSITNKIGDYLSAGRPMLNGSLNEEFRHMLETYKIGINYEPENSASLLKAIIEFSSLSKEERLMLGNNARRLAEEKFDRKRTYPNIIIIIETLMS